MPKNIDITHVFDQRDDRALGEIVIRMANRLYQLSEGSIPIMVCNPLCMQMLQGYLQAQFLAMCERDGIDITQKVVQVDENGAALVDTNFVLKPRN